MTEGLKRQRLSLEPLEEIADLLDRCQAGLLPQARSRKFHTTSIELWITGLTKAQAAESALARSEALLWLCFWIFWALNIYVVWKGLEFIRLVENAAAPFLLVMGVVMLWWVVRLAGGMGPVLSSPGKFRSGLEFWRFFVPSLTAMVGFWATVALNIPDFTRYARTQRAQAWGQALALPTTMTLFAFLGVAVTSASVLIFGNAVWDPIALIARLGRPFVGCASSAGYRDGHLDDEYSS